MIVVFIEAELRLYSCAVDSICMETLSGSLGKVHIFLAASFTDRERNLNVH